MKRDRMPTAAVIGAGFGGLALALRLQSAGIATTLFEARDKPGGRAYAYEDDGFVFDAGPTVITDPGSLEELFALTGVPLADRVELLPVEPMYRLCWEDGQVFDYVNDQAKLEQQIAALSPRDVDGYRRFLAYSREVFACGYVELASTAFLSWRDMARAAPKIARLSGWRNLYDAVAGFIRDDRLRQAFSFQALLVGGNPFTTSAIYTLIHALEREWGVWFPRGGTGALVRAMAARFVEIGGTLELNAPCDAIVVEGDRAVGVRRTAAAGGSVGPIQRFDAVASNADVVHTYGRLLRDHPRGRDEAKRLSRKRFSMSLFVVHFGLRGPPPPGLAHHTVCFGPRYRELIDEVFGNCGDALAEDFSLYLHAPCVTDPSLAPPGCGAYYVLAPVPHLGSAAIDWQVEGPRFRDRIFEHLEAHHLPGLRADLVTSRLFTPFDFRDDLNAHLGSAFSLEPVLTQSAWFRPHNRDSKIDGLYLVGAGTHPGAGVPGVLASAKATAAVMAGDFALAAPAGARVGASVAPSANAVPVAPSASAAPRAAAAESPLEPPVDAATGRRP